MILLNSTFKLKLPTYNFKYVVLREALLNVSTDIHPSGYKNI